MHSLIFFGSDQYSSVVLKSLILPGDSRKVTVVTDHKAGGTEVENLAKTHNLKVSYYPDFDRSLITRDTLGLCASFDHLIPKDLIELFNGNLYNLHPSLLPQYRNVSPVQYAILMGDKVTGITLFRISPGIDDGEIIAQAEEEILPTDTTSTLTPRLFKLGAQLFLQMLQGSVLCKVSSKNKGRILVFTHRLTRDSGHIEWNVLQKLLDNKPISLGESKNELLNLRLSINSSGNILSDLLRALTHWPGIWSTVPTRKGDLRITIESVLPSPTLKLAGKPKAISYNDFNKYYLE